MKQLILFSEVDRDHNQIYSSIIGTDQVLMITWYPFGYYIITYAVVQQGDSNEYPRFKKDNQNYRIITI